MKVHSLKQNIKLSDDVVLKVDHLSKKFCRTLKRSMYYGTLDITRSMMGIGYDTGSLRKAEFWALDDVSFELKRGETLGLIGQNGCGKTTLLRLINGIFPPDKGTIEVRGRIGALIAVGAGFHPHMTGRENIYLNGTILGMTRNEINHKMDEIIDFAEIDEFIDAPVSTYSSGMFMRLGFAIAVNANPDILLADEILAVGDLPFMMKCFRKISDFCQQGGTVLLVSHNMPTIRNTCQRGLWIEQGSVKMMGTSNEVAIEYERKMAIKDLTDIEKQDKSGTIINTDPSAKIINTVFINSEGNQVIEFAQGDKFIMRIYYECSRIIRKPVFTTVFYNYEKISVIENYSHNDGFNLEEIKGNGFVDFIINDLSIRPGNYSVTVTMKENNDLRAQLDLHDKRYHFSVYQKGGIFYGIFNPRPYWTAGNEKNNSS